MKTSLKKCLHQIIAREMKLKQGLKVEEIQQILYLNLCNMSEGNE